MQDLNCTYYGTTGYEAKLERSWGSYLPGTTAGDEAATFYANRVINSSFAEDPLARVGLGLSVLWTPDTSVETATTLATGGVGTLRSAGAFALNRFEGWSLQRITNSTVAAFEAEPASARAFLSVKELANGPAAANFGKAIERAVADQVSKDPVLRFFIEYTSKPFSKTPDFASRFGQGVYDITTKGTAWGAKHFERGYSETLRLIEYVRPSGFKF